MSRGRTPGQRAGLSRDAVLQAALAVVDGDGLQALSMRRLGTELGVEAMTVYHYVPSKDALLDGLVEQVVSAVQPHELTATSWHEAMNQLAHQMLDALLAHPNAIPAVMSRPAATRRNHELIEGTLKPLRAAGFAPHTALDVIYSVTGFVLGHVATWAGGSAASPREPQDQVRFLDDLDATEFPLLAEAAGAARTHGTPSRFDFALDAMLSGFDAARSEPAASADQPASG